MFKLTRTTKTKTGELDERFYFTNFFNAIKRIEQREKEALKIYKVQINDGYIKFIGERGYASIIEEEDY